MYFGRVEFFVLTGSLMFIFPFIFICYCLYLFSVIVLVSQTLMWFLIMIVIDDKIIHYDITVSLYMFCELKIRFLL